MLKNKEIFDRILREKDQLLSFEDPIEFIFSHSALGVGWDNPNIFNIATLNQSYSDIKKRQELGRGLRASAATSLVSAYMRPKARRRATKSISSPLSPTKPTKLSPRSIRSKSKKSMALPTRAASCARNIKAAMQKTKSTAPSSPKASRSAPFGKNSRARRITPSPFARLKLSNARLKP